MTAVGVLGPRNPGIDIGGLSEAGLTGVAAFLRGLAISPAAAASAVVGGFGLALIPTNGPLGGWVKIPGPGNVSVFIHLDEPGLNFHYTTADGVHHEWMVGATAGGVYLGPDGRVIARWAKIAGSLGLLVSTAALLNDDGPKLCPATVPDPHGPNGLAYEYFMKRLINPLNPTPLEMAYGFYGPAGNPVKIDDCQHRTGMLYEYKGPGYEYHFVRNDVIWKNQYAEMMRQAERQVEATHGKSLTWVFSERSVYLFMKGELGERYPMIHVRYFPFPGQRQRWRR